MTPQEHKIHHVKLHRALDELVADYFQNIRGLPSMTTVMELIRWSYEQTKGPDHVDVGEAVNSEEENKETVDFKKGQRVRFLDGFEHSTSFCGATEVEILSDPTRLSDDGWRLKVSRLGGIHLDQYGFLKHTPARIKVVLA